MIVLSKNNNQVLLSKLTVDDFDQLVNYLHGLSAETKNRFGPHPFDLLSIKYFYEPHNQNTGYIARDNETQAIIAYSIVKSGYLEHDSYRLQSYGLHLSHETDCTFAPSVADAWQSQRIGNSLFLFILKNLQSSGIKRIILWGGVQSNNEKAVQFYKKHGFRILGGFEYNGPNYDMIMDIPPDFELM
jgi:ribosomal protein S18 acetylase RimI-like enzyme